MAKGIYLDWRLKDPESSREYYDDIDLDNLDNIIPFCKTREFWPASWWPESKPESKYGGFVYYNVECEIQHIEKQIHVIVKYKRDNNEDDQSDPNLQKWLDEDGAIIWGTNKIIIERGENCGICKWTEEREPETEQTLYWKRKTLYEIETPSETFYSTNKRLNF